MSELTATNPGFLSDMRNIIIEAQNNAVRSVEYARMMMYWHLGERTFVEEQRGQDRAEYGSYLTKGIAAYLEAEFGSGFSVRQLELCRQFYRTYPNANDIRRLLEKPAIIYLADNSISGHVVFVMP